MKPPGLSPMMKFSAQNIGKFSKLQNNFDNFSILCAENFIKGLYRTQPGFMYNNTFLVFVILMDNFNAHMAT